MHTTYFSIKNINNVQVFSTSQLYTSWCDLSQKKQVRYFEVGGCIVTKCVKVQMISILFMALSLYIKHLSVFMCFASFTIQCTLFSLFCCVFLHQTLPFTLFP